MPVGGRNILFQVMGVKKSSPFSLYEVVNISRFIPKDTNKSKNATSTITTLFKNLLGQNILDSQDLKVKHLEQFGLKL